MRDARPHAYMRGRHAGGVVDACRGGAAAADAVGDERHAWGAAGVAHAAHVEACSATGAAGDMHAAPRGRAELDKTGGQVGGTGGVDGSATHAAHA
jgi:hypothetical protein